MTATIWNVSTYNIYVWQIIFLKCFKWGRKWYFIIEILYTNAFDIWCDNSFIWYQWINNFILDWILWLDLSWFLTRCSRSVCEVKIFVRQERHKTYKQSIKRRKIYWPYRKYVSVQAAYFLKSQNLFILLHDTIVLRAMKV